MKCAADWACADCDGVLLCVVVDWVVLVVVLGFTAFWFEGRILREGEDDPGGGDGSWCWELCRDAASGRGDGGTELRSGIVVSDAGLRCCGAGNLLRKRVWRRRPEWSR